MWQRRRSIAPATVDTFALITSLLVLCAKVLTQGRFDSAMSVSRGDSPRHSFVALSGVVSVNLVNVSTPSCKPPLRQGIDTLRIHAWPCQHLRAKYHLQPLARARPARPRTEAPSSPAGPSRAWAAALARSRADALTRSRSPARASGARGTPMPHAPSAP